MIDILLNAAKLVFSEDARKSVSAVVDFIRHSPEWQKDICSLEAKIERSEKELAALLAGLAADKMQIHKYSDRGIDAFRTSYLELTANAFDYGCGIDGSVMGGSGVGGSGKDKYILVGIDVSSYHIAVRVENARGCDFDLNRALQERRLELFENPGSYRGRGLLLVEDLADSLEQAGSRSVKAVFYRDRVEFERLNAHDPMILKLTSGIYNPSLSRRTMSIVSAALRGSDVVLDLSAYSSSPTLAVSMGIELHQVGKSTGYRFILKVNPDELHSATSYWAAGLTVVTTWMEVQERLSDPR
jgi:hypothetical protein